MRGAGTSDSILISTDRPVQNLLSNNQWHIDIQIDIRFASHILHYHVDIMSGIKAMLVIDDLSGDVDLALKIITANDISITLPP